MLQINEMLRAVMLWHQPINLVHLGWLYLGCAAICVGGYCFFAALRTTFADVL